MGWRGKNERERIAERNFKRRLLRERMPYYLRGAFWATLVFVVLTFVIVRPFG